MDTAFVGGWQKIDNGNPNNMLSSTGYVMSYANCPVVLSSKLQTKIVFSIADAKYIALSQVMPDVIQLIQLMIEINYIWTIYYRLKLFV